MGGFVEAIAKQQNKSKKEMENDFVEHSRSALPRWMSCGDGDLRDWRAFVGDKRGSAASRWWRLEGDSLKLAVRGRTRAPRRSKPFVMLNCAAPPS